MHPTVAVLLQHHAVHARSAFLQVFLYPKLPLPLLSSDRLLTFAENLLSGNYQCFLSAPICTVTEREVAKRPT